MFIVYRGDRYLLSVAETEVPGWYVAVVKEYRGAVLRKVHQTAASSEADAYAAGVRWLVQRSGVPE